MLKRTFQMPVHIKTIANNVIEYDKGRFDSWCVYLTRSGGRRYAPKDIEYFTELFALGKIYGHQRIYDDFLKFYEYTDARLNKKVLDGISRLAAHYKQHHTEIDIWFTIIYAGMVAEENKENAVLKKRIKRLGMYQVLVEGKKPRVAASFSKGKKWRELDAIMKPLGI
ncbi:MAG: DUF7004 family protein [Bacteroidales bacterium]